MNNNFLKVNKIKQTGFSLVESLVSLLILAFCVMGIMKFQVDLKMRDIDASAREKFSNLAGEFVNKVRTDPTNKGCYVAFPGSSCASTSATAYLTDWTNRVKTVTGYKEHSVGAVSSTVYTVSFKWKRKTLDTADGVYVVTVRVPLN